MASTRCNSRPVQRLAQSSAQSRAGCSSPAVNGAEGLPRGPRSAMGREAKLSCPFWVVKVFMALRQRGYIHWYATRGATNRSYLFRRSQEDGFSRQFPHHGLQIPSPLNLLGPGHWSSHPAFSLISGIGKYLAMDFTLPLTSERCQGEGGTSGR